jgi:hypothetical protein
MAQARIFISHSTYDPPSQARDGITDPLEADAAEDHARLALEVRDQLAVALRAAGHAVLLDKEGIGLGDPWRSLLNQWIGGCNAAVLLLSRRALASTYVAYEASNFSHRTSVPGSKFQLVPVFIPPVDASAVKDSPLASANLTELQGRVDTATTAQEIVAAVVGKLSNLDLSASPIEKQVQFLADLLRPVADDILLDEADKLGVDLEDWATGEPLRRVLAMKMMAVGLSGTLNLLRNIRGLLGTTPEQWAAPVGKILWLVGSAWVDYRAVDRIAALARSTRTIGSNAEKPLTARMYVVRASNLPPNDAWKVAEATETSGAFGEDEVRHAWETAIRESLRAAIPKKTDEGLNRWLASKAQNDEPVFVALPFAGLSDGLIEHLKSQFRAVTFFLLAGDTEPSHVFIQKTSAEWLDPRLLREDEQRFCEAYALNYNAHIAAESDED